MTRSLDPVDRVFAQHAAAHPRTASDQLRTMPQFRDARATGLRQTATLTLVAANRPALALGVPPNVPGAPGVVGAGAAGAPIAGSSDSGSGTTRNGLHFPTRTNA